MRSVFLGHAEIFRAYARKPTGKLLSAQGTQAAQCALNSAKAAHISPKLPRIRSARLPQSIVALPAGPGEDCLRPERREVEKGMARARARA